MNVIRFDEFDLLLMQGLVAAWLICVCSGAQALVVQDQNRNSPLPSWIDKDHWQEDGAEIVVLKTEGFLLQTQATMALVDMVREKVAEEIDLLVHAGASELVSLPERYVEANLVQDELVLDSRQLEPSFEGRKKYYGFAKLYFSQAFHETVEERYERNLRTGRLTWTGVTGVMTLAWLAVVWGYLRIDRMTRHFYARRLQTAAIVLAVAILVAGMIALLSLDPLWHDPPA